MHQVQYVEAYALGETSDEALTLRVLYERCEDRAAKFTRGKT